jgi:hypothetical protein
VSVLRGGEECDPSGSAKYWDSQESFWKLKHDITPKLWYPVKKPHDFVTKMASRYDSLSPWKPLLAAIPISRESGSTHFNRTSWSAVNIIFWHTTFREIAGNNLLRRANTRHNWRILCPTDVEIQLVKLEHCTGQTVRGSKPGRDEIFRTRPDRLWGPPVGTESFNVIQVNFLVGSVCSAQYIVLLKQSWHVSVLCGFKLLPVNTRMNHVLDELPSLRRHYTVTSSIGHKSVHHMPCILNVSKIQTAWA